MLRPKPFKARNASRSDWKESPEGCAVRDAYPQKALASGTLQRKRYSYVFAYTQKHMGARTQTQQNNTMEYSQVERHRFLIPTCKGSNPFTPNIHMHYILVSKLSSFSIHRMALEWVFLKAIANFRRNRLPLNSKSAHGERLRRTKCFGCIKYFMHMQNVMYYFFCGCAHTFTSKRQKK